MAEKMEEIEERSNEKIDLPQSWAKMMAAMAETKQQIEFFEKLKINTKDLYMKYDFAKKSFQDLESNWLKLKELMAIRVEKRLTLSDVYKIWQDDLTKTFINTKCKLNDDDIDLPDNVREKRMKNFAEENRKKLMKFGELKYYDDSEKYLQKNPHLVCENTANCLVIWCINLEIKEKYLWMEHVAHQCICMQYIIELSKQLDADDPKVCVSLFFTRIQSASDLEYKKSFDDELEAFKARIKKHSAEKVAEALKEIEEEKKLALLGQGGLNLEVFKPFPEDEDYWDTAEGLTFSEENNTELRHHEYFKESIDSAKKIGSISLDLENPFGEVKKLSSKESIYLTNLLKDSNIEDLSLSYYILDDELTAISTSKIKKLKLLVNKCRMNGLSALLSALKESKIEVLNLSGIRTSSIKNQIHILANSLTFSNVTSLDLRCIPIKFRNLKHLSDALVKTKITVLSLQGCYLSATCIEYLSSKLTSSKIQSLNLADNKMSFNGLKSLADVLENTAITELNISGNRIDSTGAIYLAEKLHKSILQKLYIENNLIKSEGCSAIGDVIHLTQITKLNLEYNSIGSNGITSLAENLKKSNVKYLNLDGNDLQINGARILANGIKDSNLEYLNVNNNQLHNIGMGMILDSLQYTKITDFHLDCKSNEMKLKNMKWVTNAFKFFKLKNLKLVLPKDTNIIRLFFNKLATLIKSNKLDEILSIKNKMNLFIDFVDMPIDTNKKNILDVLKYFHMKELCFQGNFSNSETSISSIVKVLIDIKNPISNVTTLDLSDNNIGDYGAIILAENLKYLKLTQLGLDKNDIKNCGVIAIADELKNAQIRYLNLTDNPFDSSAASYLTNAVEKHPVRIELSYYIENDFTVKDQQVIKNINYMFLKAQLLVRSIRDNSPVKYDQNLIEYFKAYEIFKNVDLLWGSTNYGPKYDYKQINSQIRSNITKNFLKIIGIVNSDAVISDLLPTELIIKICSYLEINDIKFN